jgi:glycosyltransferase involved in cell wall biosynthesis
MPKVSVIIPTYNNARHISDAIDSVLEQTVHDIEILIIDDGSVDNTKEILKKYSSRIKYIYQENKGVSAARNRGIKEARGKYVAFLDADDIWFPSKTDRQLSLFERNRHVGLVSAFMDTIDENGLPLGQKKPGKKPGSRYETAIVNGSPAPSTFMVKRECFDMVGLFDENISIFEDLDIYIRIAERYAIVVMDEILGSYRVHSSNTTKNDYGLYINQVNLAMKWISRSPTDAIRGVLRDRIKKYSVLVAKESLKNGKILRSLKYSLTYLSTLINIGKICA